MYKTKPCQYCGMDTKNKKFCNRSCSASFNNKKKGRLCKLCPSCETEFQVDSHRRKFCSRECYIEYPKKLNYVIFQSWLTGSIVDVATETKELKSAMRTMIKDFFDNTCQECGWSKVNPYSGLIPVEIDHIDGDSYNNHVSNIRVLCPSCHSLTSTFRGLNPQSSRTYRLK